MTLEEEITALKKIKTFWDKEQTEKYYYITQELYSKFNAKYGYTLVVRTQEQMIAYVKVKNYRLGQHYYYVLDRGFLEEETLIPDFYVPSFTATGKYPLYRVKILADVTMTKIDGSIFFT